MLKTVLLRTAACLTAVGILTGTALLTSQFIDLKSSAQHADAAGIAAENERIELQSISADDDTGEETALLWEEIPVTSFRVTGLSPGINTNGLDYVDWWYNELEDCRYLFLPATADRSKLHVQFKTEGGAVLSVNGKPLTSGTDTDAFTEDTLALTVNGKACGELRVMQSQLNCVYLSLETGSTDYIDSHRAHTDTGEALMLTPEGAVQYQGAIPKIGGHGNSSFDYSKKKPYNIKLEEKANLFGLGKAKKWVLMSNFLDHSLLRNRVTLDMGRQAGLEFTLDSTYVDLFVNGSYRGCYELFEKAQVQKNRVNITDLEELTEELNDKELDEYEHLAVGGELREYKPDLYKYYAIPNNPADITGGYLVQFQLYNRFPGKTDSGFVTSRGLAVQIDEPEYASQAQVLYIRKFVQELEDAIYSDTGYNSLGKHYSDYIDVDSLIIGYLVQEISQNADGSQTSFYLYKESDTKGDGKLHYGPAWDFDLGYCNFLRGMTNPDGETVYTARITDLWAANQPISGYDPDLEDGLGSQLSEPDGWCWLAKLYRKDEYRARVSELYYELFDGHLLALSDTAQEGGALVTQMGEAYAPMAAMNNARWHMLGGKEFKPLGPKNGDTYEECVEYIRSFIERRREALRKIWLPERQEALCAEVDALTEYADPVRYGETGVETIEQCIADGKTAINAAATYEDACAAAEAAKAAVAAVPVLEIPGDFDVNFAVETEDVRAILHYYAGSLIGLDDGVTEQQLIRGDVDGNGEVDVLDARHILLHIVAESVDMEYPLPVTG